MVVNKSHSQEVKKINMFSGVQHAYLGNRFSSVSSYIFVYIELYALRTKAFKKGGGETIK